MEITKELYRNALHFYLVHAYPDDDMEYYSKWAWLVSPRNDFFDQGEWDGYYPPSPEGFPREVRFGCYCSGNTKLRCYFDGFMFDTNHGGDTQQIIDRVKEIKSRVQEDWRKHGIPVHGDRIEP